jgi:putative transposase
MGYKDWWLNSGLGRAKVRMAHTFTNILIHAVFSTSGRSPLLPDTIRPNVHAYLGGILRELHAVPVAIGGTADHVHLLTRLPADLAVADCMRIVKTNSSRWVKERWSQRRSFAWQSGYGAFAVSESRRAAVVRYIENQAEHHKRISYQDEFLKLLRSHGVDFDARYVWQ